MGKKDGKRKDGEEKRGENERSRFIKRTWATQIVVSGLGEFAAVAAGVFEEGEEIGHAEEGARGLVHVDEFEFAAAGAAAT